MNRDKRIELAQNIARELIDVHRTEWNKWVEYLRVKGNLAEALKLAEVLSNSPTLRVGPSKAYKSIFRVINKHKLSLDKIPFDEILEIFGFIGWELSHPVGFGMWAEREE